ncbi:NUDIX domain-containing protein [Candidatus Saccharibacteria bacterium]|nr:MAG: NUDIX domain-containing protein [Candidatus Saccharibacteria bacterium]
MSTDRFKLTAAVYLVLRKDGQLLLLRRANTGYQDGKYGLVAGHLEGDELATAAMVREAAEEAGITVDSNALRFVHVAHRLGRGQHGQERVDLFFEATEWHGEAVNAEPEKCDDLSWFDLDALPENMLPFVRRVLTDIASGITYSEYTIEPVD